MSCYFGSGVKVDPPKIVSMLEWPIPISLKALKGFLGLMGYYKKFIMNYGIIATSLTGLSKKNTFFWIEEAT